MYHLLLVDDEVSVIRSISALMDWSAHGIGRVDTCLNAPDALAHIRTCSPDIVITDIRMPVMSGIDLIAQANDEGHDIEFIILSGYDDFNFAKSAMKYGVRHYLLKPCSEEEIAQALRGAAEDLARRRRREMDAAAARRAGLEMLRQSLMLELQGIRYGGEFTDRYRHLEDGGVRMAFLRFSPVELPDPAQALETLQAAQGGGIVLVEPIFRIRDALGAFYLCDGAAFPPAVANRMRESLGRLAGTSLRMSHRLDLPPDSLPRVLKESFDPWSSCRLIGPGGERVLQRQSGGEAEINAMVERLEQAFQGGARAAAGEAQALFSGRDRSFVVPVCTKLLLKRLYEGALDAEQLTAAFNRIYEAEDISSLPAFLFEIITPSRQEERESGFVDDILRYLDQNLDNPDMSLKYIAREVVFRNEDYVGRAFSAQVGMSFTRYLNAKRIERAKFLISVLGEDKLYTVAEQVGLGNNPSYFSRLFKRETGCTPGEYRALCSVRERENT